MALKSRVSNLFGRMGRRAVPTMPPLTNGGSVSPVAGAQRGKAAAGFVRRHPIATGIGAAAVGGAIMRRRGRGTDRSSGRPTGMYGY